MATSKNKDARKFARVAKQRLDKAKLIHEKLELWAAAEYIGGYAVECGLKALVIVVTPRSERPEPGGETIDWMKTKFGHGLNGLRLYLSRRGARMPKDVSTDFLYVSTWDPQRRYEPGPGDPERTERFLGAAESVVKWATGRLA